LGWLVGEVELIVYPVCICFVCFALFALLCLLCFYEYEYEPSWKSADNFQPGATTSFFSDFSGAWEKPAFGPLRSRTHNAAFYKPNAVFFPKIFCHISGRSKTP
jgi:hypothetical protein